MIAVYLGETDENKINDMSIPFFHSVLNFLGKKVNYDAVVNYAGNSFMKDSYKLIQSANPLVKEVKIGRGMFEKLSTMKVDMKKGEDAKKNMAWIFEDTKKKEDGKE